MRGPGVTVPFCSEKPGSRINCISISMTVAVVVVKNKTKQYNIQWRLHSLDSSFSSDKGGFERVALSASIHLVTRQQVANRRTGMLTMTQHAKMFAWIFTHRKSKQYSGKYRDGCTYFITDIVHKVESAQLHLSYPQFEVIGSHSDTLPVLPPRSKHFLRALYQMDTWDKSKAFRKCFKASLKKKKERNAFSGGWW